MRFRQASGGRIGFGVLGARVPRGAPSGRGGVLPPAPVPPMPAMVNLPSLIDDARRFELVYRPRLVGHRVGAYAARAAAGSCSCLIAAGGLNPCRSIGQVAL